MRRLALLIIAIIVGFHSCKKNTEITKFNLNQIESNYILEEPTLLGDEIILPKGTQWKFTDKDHSEVEFILPPGFAFLLYNKATGQAKISLIGGGYSCTCSENGSCTVFWNDEFGYGCLQNTCKGTCTGKKAKKNSNFTIEGVIYLKNDMIDINKPTNTASLSSIGKEIFFNVTEVRNEIKRTYDFVYKHIKTPDAFKEDALKFDRDKYIMVKTYLYGVEMALLIPNDENIDEYFPSIQKLSAPSSCDCSSGESSGCELKTKGFFGYKVYYCNGCKTCTMH